MKKLLYSCLALLVAATLFSCEKDSLIQEPTQVIPSQTPSNPYRISLKEALATADLILNGLDGAKTRSPRSLKSVEYYVNQTHTRSGADTDTMLYIVNFADEEGFAILGADRRIKPVYGFSNQGNLDLSDTVNNRGLALCMQNIRYSLPTIKPIERDTIKPIPGIIEPFPIDPGFEDEYKIITDIKPMLQRNPSLWAQETHFNDYCPGVFGSEKPGLVGCVPVACTQIMSYYKWPTSYNGLNLNWDEINNTAIERRITYVWEGKYHYEFSCPTILARFLAEVGKTLKAEYGFFENGEAIWETGVSTIDLRDNFSKFGYSYILNPKTFTYSEATEDLKNGPLLVLGSNPNLNIGHCWIIDGYILYNHINSYYANPTHSQLYSFFHCVWGWGGLNNGYFDYENGFDTNPVTNPIIKPDGDDNTADYRKYTQLQYFTNFKPIK